MGQLSQRRQYAKGGIGRWYWDLRDREIIKRIPDKARNILDIGCGEGLTLEKVKKEYPAAVVFGIDNSTDCVRACSFRGLPVTLGHAYEIPFPGESMGCILLTEVIEHLLIPDKALGEIRRVLRPGGTAIILFPNDYVFFAARLFFGKWREAFADSGHLRKFNPDRALGLIASCGFKIASVSTLPWGLAWWASLHCLIVARKPA